jgi:hypothetical protein
VATDRSPGAGQPAQQPRPASAIRAELTDLRRYLVETPPHHGAGVRDALVARIALLERELAATDE